MNGDVLQKRFEAVSRGRAVRIVERASTILNNDFEVAYEEEANAYRAELTRNGWFEEAYRFVERWIKRHAEKLDGVYRAPPADYVDCRNVSLFWMFERQFDRFMEDCRTGLAHQVRVLERERPNEGVSGEVTVEARVRALRGVMAYHQMIMDEVHTAVLSPRSLEFLKAIGLDCF